MIEQLEHFKRYELLIKNIFDKLFLDLTNFIKIQIIKFFRFFDPISI